MKIPNYRKTNKYIRAIIITTSAFFIISKAVIAIAEKKNTDHAGETKKADEIHVTADRLKSDRNAQYAEFTGNVVVTRSDSVLTCEQVKIIYSEKSKKDKPKTDSGAIDQIIATGNVVITFEDKVAVSDQAVYHATDDTIVLTGNKPKVTSGKSFVSGEKITLNRTSGKIFVDSGESTRVNAEFHPGDKGLKKPEKKE